MTAKFNRQNNFRVTRKLDVSGFYVYSLENVGRNEKIIVRRFLFDRLRSKIRIMLKDYKKSEQDFVVDTEIDYKAQPYYIIKNSNRDKTIIKIKEVYPLSGSTGSISFSAEALPSLDELLQNPKLQHANEVLDRIVSYHKLFQFSFTEGSESITSDLSTRKSVFSHIEKYTPTLGQRTDSQDVAQMNYEAADSTLDKTEMDHSGDDQGMFKSRLAERSSQKVYKIDYESLFKGRMHKVQPDNQSNLKIQKRKAAAKNMFSLPVLATDVKSFTKTPFKCEFSTEDMKDFRGAFLGKRDEDLYVGFEMMDAVHRTEGGTLKTFKFPLYYMKVEVKESGRNIYVEPSSEGRVYMNHLALANLVDKFAKPLNGRDKVDVFFNNLLAQKIEVDGELSRLYLMRSLPYSEDIFQKTREILLGLPGENGKGGILSDLKVIGIECDLESVFLYKIPKSDSAVQNALDEDLGEIVEIARSRTKNFNNSLLGGFLSPELYERTLDKNKFCETAWIPGALSKSTKKLLEQINDHDLMLLEGPPGTGKTFAIMNLFFHCLSTGKRLLVVSDQSAAIHALVEKIEEYLLGRDRTSAEARNLMNLWKSSVKVVDEIPNSETKLSTWVKNLKDMLAVDQANQNFFVDENEDLAADMEALDKKISKEYDRIQRIMDLRVGAHQQDKERVASKDLHATTSKDINEVVAYIDYLNRRSKGRRSYNKTLVMRYVDDLERMRDQNWIAVYKTLLVPENVEKKDIDTLVKLEASLRIIRKNKPKTVKAFTALMSKMPSHPILDVVEDAWQDAFDQEKNKFVVFLNFILSYFKYPLEETLSITHQVVSNFLGLMRSVENEDPSIRKQLKAVYLALGKHEKRHPTLSLEISRLAVNDALFEDEHEDSIQKILTKISVLQSRRDKVVRKQVIASMNQIARSVYVAKEGETTSLATSIAASLESLKTQTNIHSGKAFLNDLKNHLVNAFPIWICRKQAVSFLFPCVEKSFDLVIVDEATQCRVDDALPLLYRAKKLLVVGDEKQTVLAKNSVIDDYLFKEFSLEEHLRYTQARGLKGGGSHIFGLVKGIKQAHVMLDEHYRCPPDIIQYSNHYVYHDELKTMQWKAQSSESSVVVDFSEKKAPTSYRKTSGQYKGLETDMIDRYLDYVHKTLMQIEKEAGRRINVETDVALCYFLLKNEPYIKRVKGDFLQKLNRGNDILDGAGAALQGKERDYIFYFWDVSRANMMAFRMGDDEDKRKGELNVLMSRPKVKAFHYLHQNFDKLDHSKASITDYLWKTYNAQQQVSEKKTFKERTKQPDAGFSPWGRSSGPLFSAILDKTLSSHEDVSLKSLCLDSEFSIVVGDPRVNVDLMLVPKKPKPKGRSLGIVDLGSFKYDKKTADEIVDYYFQLKRATPSIDPVFAFMYELANKNSTVFKTIKKLTSIKQDKQNKKAG